MTDNGSSWNWNCSIDGAGDPSCSATKLTTASPSSIEYLVVGGAGGFKTGAYSITAGAPITVTVGAGGNKAVFGSNSSPTNGEDSSFGSITALGGGYGGGRYGGSQATVGGSGGGGSESGGDCLAAAGTSGQGNAGGDCYPSHHGGGGGGAGTVGGTASASSVGDGGAGLMISITGTATYYAGGGGYNPEAGGSGGYGGGGKGGSKYEHGSDGEANTGGGGGDDDRDGGNGGSGVVIIRYPDTFGAAETTGSPTVITAGGYRIYKWISSGSITFGGTASTSPPLYTNGNTCVCGSANGQSFSSEPTTDLCSSSCNGAINMNYNGSAWNWNCSVSGASDPSCSAAKIVSTSLFNADEYKAAKAMQLISIGLYSDRDEALAAFEAAWATKDPYLHYLQFGSKEGINPSNNFDESSYYEAKLAQLQNTNAVVDVPGCPSTWAGRTVSELKACFDLNGFTPLTHYLTYGIQEGLTPIPVPSSEQVFPWW